MPRNSGAVRLLRAGRDAFDRLRGLHAASAQSPITSVDSRVPLSTTRGVCLWALSDLVGGLNPFRFVIGSGCGRAVRDGRSRGPCCFSATARVEAEAARAERNDLHKAARHRDILEEVDELVLIAQLVMECQRRCDREYGKDGGRPTGTKSQDANRYIPDLGLGEAVSDYRAVFSGVWIGDLRQAEEESVQAIAVGRRHLRTNSLANKCPSLDHLKKCRVFRLMGT